MSEENKPTEAPQGQATELTINDLGAIKSIIDVASQRGAFKPNEMVTIGQVYNKLESFLAVVQAQQAQQTEGSAEPAAEPKGE